MTRREEGIHALQITHDDTLMQIGQLTISNCLKILFVRTQ